MSISQKGRNRITPQDLTIAQAQATKYGVPWTVMQATINRESGGYSNPVSSDSQKSGRYTHGMMQVMPGTYATLAKEAGWSDKYDGKNVEQNCRAAAYLLRKDNIAICKALGISPAPDYTNPAVRDGMYQAYNKGQHAGIEYAQNVVAGKPVDDTYVKSGRNGTSPNLELVGEGKAVARTGIVAPEISDKALADVNVAAKDLVIKNGLEETAWYDQIDGGSNSNGELIVGNPHLRAIPTPVSFIINLKELNSAEQLSNADGPIIIKLNCSLSRLNITMKHIINKSNTRTGVHLTFWGMEPDVITGSGSTGVFMNTYGLTSIMSLQANEDLAKLAKTITETKKTEKTESIWPTPPAIALSEKSKALEAAKSNTTTPKPRAKDTEFRVAAQDAFVELLALFRNNGLIRYSSSSSESPVDLARDRIGQSLYSEKYGDTSSTRDARHNDIMIKGNINMNYKNTVYMGYFKSLQWMMDAESPYQWTFDFTFQVQRTFSQVYYPTMVG